MASFTILALVMCLFYQSSCQNDNAQSDNNSQGAPNPSPQASLTPTTDTQSPSPTSSSAPVLSTPTPTENSETPGPTPASENIYSEESVASAVTPTPTPRAPNNPNKPTPTPPPHAIPTPTPHVVPTPTPRAPNNPNKPTPTPAPITPPTPRGAPLSMDQTVDTIKITVENDNLPQYQFSSTEVPEESYTFTLLRLYQVLNGKKIGPVYEPRGWVSSPLVSSGNVSSFNLTYFRSANAPFDYLQLRNHMFTKDALGSPCPSTVCVKFDIVVENFGPWAHPEAGLVFSFSVASTKNGDPTRLSEGKVAIGSFTFSIIDSALAIKDGVVSPVVVNMTSDADGTNVIYEHFEGSLVHDPLLGIESEAAAATLLALIIALPLLAGFFVLAMMIRVYQHEDIRYYESPNHPKIEDMA